MNRLARILLTIVCFSWSMQATFAFDIWNGTDVSTSLQGQGTAANPYQIWSAPDLKFLADKVNAAEKRWTNVYVKQMVDIDLGGHEWTPIGMGDGKSFVGHYDGCGYEIRNLYLRINNTALYNTDRNACVGLFGNIGCQSRTSDPATSVVNVHLKNPVITVDAPFLNTTFDFRLGFIAGSVETGVKIHSCVVTDGYIGDNGNNVSLRSIFVGGIAGNFNTTITTTGNNVPAASAYRGPLDIKYVAVDFVVDFPNTITNAVSTSSSQNTQYNIGGIIGRMRRGSRNDVPDYCVVKAKVNAPRATISPVFGLARGNADTSLSGLYMTRAYAGEFAKNVTGNADGDYEVGGLSSANRYFTEYQIYNPKVGEYEEITGTYPEASADRLYGTRTLEPNGKADGTATDKKFDPTSPTGTETALGMQSFQGVNCGTYFDSSDDNNFAHILTMLNTNDTGISFVWKYAHNHFEFAGPESATMTRKSARTFQALIDNYDEAKAYTYRWTCVDKIGRTYNINIAHNNQSSSNDHCTVTSNGRYSHITLKEESKVWEKVIVRIYDGADNFLDTDTITLSDIEAAATRTVAYNDEGSRDHYLFTAKLNSAEPEMYADEAYINTLDVEWQINVDGAWVNLRGSQFDADPTDTNPMVAHVKPTYVGNIRLYVYDTEGGGDYRYLLSQTTDIAGNTYDYVESIINSLHLSFSMRMLDSYDPATGEVQSSLFDPSQYYNASGLYNPDDTTIKPIVLEASVVDQFGNDWLTEENRSKWRIQWNYRIPHDGESADQTSDNYDEMIGWNSVNGRFDPTDTSTYGLTYGGEPTTITDWHEYTGYYRVSPDGLKFIIHPNLLLRTMAFWVRAELFDIENDPQGNFPTVSEAEFNQLAVKFERVKDANGVTTGYIGKVVYRGTGETYEFDDQASLTIESIADLSTYDWTTEMGPLSVPAGQPRQIVINDVDPERFYRLTFESSGGVTARDIIGPTNTVFVYNRAISLANPDRHNFDDYDYELNSYYATGLDVNHGHSPRMPVCTMERAFQILDADGTTETNRIVVMGYYEDPDFINYETSPYKKSTNPYRYNKAVTITGNSGSLISGGTIGFQCTGTNTEIFELALQAPMKLENIDLWRVQAPATNNYNCIYCWNHDFTVDRGVRMMHFPALTATGAGLASGTAAVNLTIVAGRYNTNVDMDTDEGKIDYSGNADPNRTTITLLSGAYARVLGGARNNAERNITHNIYGTPTNPNRVTINIDIQHESGNDAEYMPNWSTAHIYNTEIGILVGGQTDGSIYSDSEINLYNGHVTRYASGNITYGRPMPAAPDDSFFGRTVLNIHGGQIDELYGGNLGRTGGSTTELEGFFYGHSEINLYGGSVGDPILLNGEIYAAGAGAVNGLGADWDIHSTIGEKAYTPDPSIPYIDTNNNNKLKYGNFEEVTADGHHMPVMEIHNSDGTTSTLDLTHTTTEVNLYGGIVNGNVFGGGLGYTVALEYNKAPMRRWTFDGVDYTQCLSGTLFGSARVTMSETATSSPTVKGNVYGGGAGSSRYVADYVAAAKKANANMTDEEVAAAEAEARKIYGKMARIYGTSEVILTGGIVEGNVYAGGGGVATYVDMAAMVGDTHLEIGGDFTVMGNVFGGGALADVNSYIENGTIKGGNTSIEITDGIIGNNIFGASEGAEGGLQTHVMGNTSITITGGQFYDDPFIRDSDDQIIGQRTFNIYGGGYYMCDVLGNTSIYATRSLLVDESSIIPAELNPNHPDTWASDFDAAFRDITFRRFCVYGGGYGEMTRVRGNASIHINIDPADAGVVTPTEYSDFSQLVSGQSFFDISGGGYAGDVGYWADADGTAIVDRTTAYTHNDFQRYINGDVNVTIEGNPFIRKVIGGGFYASVNNSNMLLKGGLIENVYGGSLMGYVHNCATTLLGSSVREDDPAVAAEANSRLIITKNVYGGNDVKGIVGTTFWLDDDGNRAAEDADSQPIFASDVSDAANKGVVLSVRGGTILGNVYGAGNGHYRGYYVPDWTRYNDGPARHYRTVTSALDPTKTGRIYRSRPMTGSVKVHIGGNDSIDRVDVRGDVYGGGRSCTVGQWNTILPFEDPRRLTKGGFTHLNVGSHVTINGSLYLGAEGTGYARQDVVPAGIDINTFDGSTTAQLMRLGDVAYNHWYYDATAQRYKPGFPEPGTLDGNYGLTGEHMLRGFLKNIEMNGDVEFTFYDWPFQTDDAGNTIYDTDADGEKYPRRKTWLPGEQATFSYDASDVVIGNIFGGGAVGSMTNNHEMLWDYGTQQPVDPQAPGFVRTSDMEQNGAIYRITVPRNITIRDRIVGGSENAVTDYYPYGPGYHSIVKIDGEGNSIDPLYTFTGGIVTQSAYTYGIVIYNDIHDTHQYNYTNIPYSEYEAYANEPEYTLKDGTKIYRLNYDTVAHTYANPATLGSNRFAMAVTKDDDGKIYGYFGKREERPSRAVIKMTLANTFVPLVGQPETNAYFDDNYRDDERYYSYGGVVYGGCFESGTVIGDIIINAGSDMLGQRFVTDDQTMFGRLSTLRYNFGRIFGGGYGTRSHVEGDTYINLVRRFVGMNVFGGGCRGNVYGRSTINYYGDEKYSYVYGAIYGGGLYGSVGVKQADDPVDYTNIATNISLISGNVDHVYGGSCLGNLYGRSDVKLYDEVGSSLDHLDIGRLNYINSYEDWSGSRLIVGSVFGGNDISGTITPQPLASYDGVTETDAELDSYSTRVYVYEKKSSDPTQKATPGSYNGFNGFPLIGNIYGGSNAAYGEHDNTEYYTGGEVYLAVGDRNAVMRFALDGGDGPNREYLKFAVPHIDRAKIEIKGGTVINAFGGGDMSSINEVADITVDYDDDNIEARAGFKTIDEVQGMFNVLHLSSREQVTEVLHAEDDGYVFDQQVHRLFGGNNLADMAIQPTWHLDRGYVGSLYSGGNFGRMTYFNAGDPGNGVKPSGLSVTVDAPNIHIGTIYGGGRVGDIAPAIATEHQSLIDDNFYGATLNIYDGVIDNVYGGNDVSGTVYYGANVNIYGAISGDVYCAGNGNYRYQYDYTLDPLSKVVEEYNDDFGGRYFRLPYRDGFGLDEYTGDVANKPADAQRLLAINSYRPNVGRAKLVIKGLTPDKVTYVRGSVFCGGNSSTVSKLEGNAGDGNVKLEIGDNVILNSVYMGSNGEMLTDATMMQVTEALNDININDANDLPGDNTYTHAADEPDLADATEFHNLIDLYMLAVEMRGIPEDFDFNPNLTNAYIGNFYVGGNRGSMTTDRKIALTFPDGLVVYGKIVGGSNNARVKYKTVAHDGGLTRRLGEGQGTEKVHLTVKSRFEPWKLYVDENDVRGSIKLIANIEEIDGEKYFGNGGCIVYGGCYQSGRTVGDIHIDLYSDMLAEPAANSALADTLEYYGISKKQIIVDAIDNLSRRTFAVVGGGYGEESSVYGNILVQMLPGKSSPTNSLSHINHPSAAALFAGSQKGLVVGNTTIKLRDGDILANMYGGSEAAVLYGSTQIMVGWPKYYVAKQDVKCTLARTDNISKGARDENFKYNENEPTETEVVKTKAWYRKGDIVSIPVYEAIASIEGGVAKVDAFDFVDYDMPENFPIATQTFKDADGTVHNFTSEQIYWRDIDIHVGNQLSRTDMSAKFFGHGNIYGGGFVPFNADVDLAGQKTVRYFTDEYTPAADQIGFGGNSTILVWDNYNNANSALKLGGDPSNSVTVPGLPGQSEKTIPVNVRDHITVGTGRYVKADKAKLTKGKDIMGYYLLQNIDGVNRYVHQAPHVLTEAEAAEVQAGTLVFYEMECDGGIYGGGRTVFVEGFRSCDLAYYGYADYSPQYPKLINTIQRLDLMRITDCCLQLQGSQDFATNTVASTKYSITRVGELQLYSSIVDPADTYTLQPGVRETSGLRNIQHTAHRSRNYVALFHDVLYLAGLTSNVDFNSKLRGSNGEIGKVSNGMTAAEAWDDFDGSYRGFKSKCIDEYYEFKDDASSFSDADKDARSKRFQQRNMGTAANMIGLNNGYTLEIQGVKVDAANKDHQYYGPVTGVIEVKLLTLAPNEGGGYVFALNQHDDPSNFLETTGNFVFPGAAYRVNENDTDIADYNYVYDDCFPMGRGWEYYYKYEGSGGPTIASNRLRTPAHQNDGDTVPEGHGNTNTDQEIHYWYVNGTNYYYNVNLTGITLNKANGQNSNTDFVLDESNRLVYLYGLPTDAPTKFKIESVTWTTSSNVDSDIQHYAADGDGGYERPYSLFLSVDKENGTAHTLSSGNTANGFVAQIPRANGELVVNEGVATLNSDDNVANLSLAASNNFNALSSVEGSTIESNTPLLGFTLVDNQDNNPEGHGRDYYNEHLSKPELVTIVLRDEHSTLKYTINLTIDYVLGPSVTGKPVVENCALPGEYIYANAFDVDVDLDESSLTVLDRSWYLIPDNAGVDLASNASIENFISTHSDRLDEICLNDQKFGGENQVHIPAYWSRNGMALVYAVNFSAGIPVYLVADERIEVHNYHRMRPWNGVSYEMDVSGYVMETDCKGVYGRKPLIEDLQLVEGANIYIEDDYDLAYFYEYLMQHQAVDGPTTVTGKVRDPRYGRGLNFFVTAPLLMAKSTYLDAMLVKYGLNTTDGIRFEGNFNGMGYAIMFDDNDHFISRNAGKFYNTGFISNFSTPASGRVCIFTDNTGGEVQNCYYYNAQGGVNSNRTLASNGTLNDCYQLTPSDVSGLNQIDRSYFNYGLVAYNLNRYYLERRYTELSGNANPEVYVESIYRDGEYRFAKYDPDGVGTPDALRTADIPNYRDLEGTRLHCTDGSVLGSVATYHNTAHPVDEDRIDRNADNSYKVDDQGRHTYHPLFPVDYLFFGQDLAHLQRDDIEDTEVRIDEVYGVPRHINETNRVYRASGFYGSAIDEGYFFNVDAVAMNPRLTAIDFAGYRDARYPGATRGVQYHQDQTVYYEPMHDLPEAISGFTVGDDVTRNLLVYFKADDESVKDPVEAGMYDAHTPVSDIRYHVVKSYDPLTEYPTKRPKTECLHLVDRNDFDAPIEFEVTGSAWYDRNPDIFSTGNDAWEGICLPFTAKTVTATSADPTSSNSHDHGELSHFYGPGVGLDNEAPSHEYWMRKFYEFSDDKLYFTRPGSELDNNLPDEYVADYLYHNTFFHEAYGDAYADDYIHGRPEYSPTSEGVHNKNYPVLTKSMPYIVAFPGKRFYEFDLSGEFYAEKLGGDIVAQTITWRNTPAATETLIIPVSQYEGKPVDATHNGYSFTGTFQHYTPSARTAVIHEEIGDNHSFFSRAISAGEQVDPFRCYVTMPSSSPAPLMISSRNIDFLPQQPDEPDDLTDEIADLDIYVDDNVLVVNSPFENSFELPIFDIAGRHIRQIQIFQGENRYHGLSQGYYLLRNTKFFIR